MNCYEFVFDCWLLFLDTCQQPMDTGPCRGNIPRWYFDKDSKQCLEFLYGGCQGNTNNFESREECQKSCASDTVEPEKQGTCYLMSISDFHI